MDIYSLLNNATQLNEFGSFVNELDKAETGYANWQTGFATSLMWAEFYFLGAEIIDIPRNEGEIIILE